jgi:AcrR family transcriptional regulator
MATRAGVGKGSVYRQFSSKEELYIDTVIEGFVDVRTQVLKNLETAQTVPEKHAAKDPLIDWHILNKSKSKLVPGTPKL